MKAKKKTGKGKAFTKKELKTVKQGLVRMKARILEELVKLHEEGLNKTFKDSSGDLSGYSFHMADMATDLYDREFLLGLAEGERDRLLALDEAIKSIDEGTYGKCLLCGNPISRQRLKFMPEAKYCLEDQEKKEKSDSNNR